MNRLTRLACITIIALSTFPSAHGIARADAAARDAQQSAAGTDTTRGTTGARIPGRVDSTRTDSLRRAVPDTSAASSRSAIRAKSDSLVRIVPFGSVGSLDPVSARYAAAGFQSILWNDYRTLTDLLSPIPGVFVYDKASPGQEQAVSFTGAGASSTGFLVDGVERNDPFTRTYNFALFPVEAIDKLEVVSGTRAFLYGENTAGGAVNVVTQSFANNKPYTRIRYSQGANTYTQTDAMFAQNIFTHFNLSFGLSYLGYGDDNARLNYPGRFFNAASQGYAFRTKLRYNVSPTMNIVFTHMYNRTMTNLNGGIDLMRTAPVDWYNEAVAVVVNLDAYEKRSNHHLALSGVYRPTGDSTLSATVTVFGSHQLREYRDEENRRQPNGITVHDNFEASVIGALAQADWTWGGNSLNASAEVRETQYERSVFSPSATLRRQRVSVKDELSPFRFVTLAGFVKVEDGQKQLLENFGADASLRISDVMTATAGASQAHRRPTMEEAYLASGAADTTIARMLSAPGLAPWPTAHLPLEDEIHHVAEAGLRFTPHAQFAVSLSASRRMIDHWIDNSLIAPHQGQNVTFDIVTASVQTHLGHIHLDASGEYTHQSDVVRGSSPVQTMLGVTRMAAYNVLLRPEWRGEGSLYFRGPLAKGNLDLKAGVKGRFWSSYDGEQYRFADGVPNPTFRQRIGNAGVLDAFVIAHIGDAQIHVIVENVTGTDYMLAPYYPMYGTSFRFGVTWEFED